MNSHVPAFLDANEASAFQIFRGSARSRGIVFQTGCPLNLAQGPHRSSQGLWQEAILMNKPRGTLCTVA